MPTPSSSLNRMKPRNELDCLGFRAPSPPDGPTHATNQLPPQREIAKARIEALATSVSIPVRRGSLLSSHIVGKILPISPAVKCGSRESVEEMPHREQAVLVLPHSPRALLTPCPAEGPASSFKVPALDTPVGFGDREEPGLPGACSRGKKP